MALIDRVKERFSTKRLVEITNPEDASFSTVDDAFLGHLCDDVIAYLDGEAVGTYDESDPRWVALAADGVIALGQARISADDWNRERWERWMDAARSFARTLRRDALTPQIASPERPSRFDADTMRHLIPGRPRRRRP
jgi:hypothetical protein